MEMKQKNREKSSTAGGTQKNKCKKNKQHID